MANQNGLQVQVSPGFDVQTPCPDCNHAIWLTATGAVPVASRVTPLSVNQAKVQGQMHGLFAYKTCMWCGRAERYEPDRTTGTWKLAECAPGSIPDAKEG